MKAVNLDELKAAYRNALVNKLVDEKRGIDWSEYANESSDQFNTFIDNLSLPNILEDLRVEVEEESKGYPPSADEYKLINKVLGIIDKYIAD